ncbi:MAG: S41 family peptidase [Smithellaceae bacterium]
MIKIKKYSRIFVAVLFFITLALSTAFASAEKSIIQEVIPLVMDNYIDQPDMYFLAAQALEGAKLKLQQEKKNVPALNDPQANSGMDKNTVIAFIKDNLARLSNHSGVSYQELEYAALKHLTVGLDPNSDFLSPQEMKELTDSQKGVFAGVGMEVGIKDNILTVVTPIDDSPALAAGILAGDQILQINDTPTKNLTIIQAVNLIRGETGSIVRILIMRKSFDKPREFTITRALITVKSVKYRQMEEGIGYLRITSFQNNTSAQVEEALNALGSRQHRLKGLVIDLRNNPGGLLDQSLRVTDKFIDNDLIITVKGRAANSETKHIGKTMGTHPSFPIIILINSGSASAAEILSGSLHSYNKAVLIGEKTYGKGTVQTLYNLSDGSGLKLTTHRYYLPSGAAVSQGINPDVIVAEKEGEDYPLAVAQNVFQKMTKSGYSANFEQLITLARQTPLAAIPPAQADFKANKITLQQTNTTAITIEKPSFTATERIWTENDLAVIVGVEKYQDLPAAEYSAKDARLVKDYLISLGLKERNVELLLNERATLSSIKKTLESWLPNRAKKNSRVLIYYSGHGAPEASSGDAYLVPYDGDPNYLSDTGYPLKRLYEKMGRLPVKEIIVVLDSCFSGAGGRSVLAKGARPLVMMTEAPIINRNMVVLSAAEGSQISTSSPEKGHGLFTYYFLKALNDGKKNIVDVYEYIKPQVEDDAKALNVRQTPQISPKAEKLYKKFYLRN